MRDRTALRIKLSATDLADIQIALRPAASAQALLLDSLGDSGGGADQTVRATLRSRVGREGIAAYRPIVPSGRSFCPPIAVPEVISHGGWSHELAERLAGAAPDAVTAQLMDHYGDTPPPHWLPALSDPVRWLGTMASAVADTADILENLIGRAQSRLEAEHARLADALSTQAPAALLNSLSPRVSFIDGELRIEYGRDIDIQLRGRLTLVPLLAGPRSFLLYDSGDDLYLGYPMRGALQATLNSATPTIDRLVALIGPVRAQVLRVLGSPVTMSGLARALECAPSTATHHCRGLTEAGLISLVRVGRTTWVIRTSTGDALVELLGSPVG